MNLPFVAANWRSPHKFPALARGPLQFRDSTGGGINPALRLLSNDMFFGASVSVRLFRLIPAVEINAETQRRKDAKGGGLLVLR